MFTPFSCNKERILPFCRAPETRVTLGFSANACGSRCEAAAAHDDARRGIEFLHARHALAGFFFRLARDGAGIQNIQIGGDEFVRDLVAEFGKPLHERTALAVVHLAAERKDDRLFHCISPSANKATEVSAIAAVSARRIRFPSVTPA